MTSGIDEVETGKPRPSVLSVLRMRVFGVLYVAETVSIAGDQLARVALSVLVFERTGSAWATAATYALTYLPAILGGALLGGVGDRFPRRAVMVVADIVRAALFLLMAIGGVPIALLMALLAVAVFIGPSFSAAMAGHIAARLDTARFRVGTGFRMMTSQIAQVAGFGIGGVVVGAVNPRGALVIDAVTFAISATVIAVFLRDREPLPAADAAAPVNPGDREDRDDSYPVGPAVGTDDPDRSGAGVAFRGLWNEPAVRRLVLLGALAGFFVVPEGLAVPYASDNGLSTTVAGLLLAALPLGGAVGALVLVTRVRRVRGVGLVSWMAVACGLPLAVTALEPPWPAVFAAWAVSGALSAYQVEAAAEVVDLVPDGRRSQVIARAGATVVAAQGVGLLLFGALGGGTSPAVGIAAAGLAGSAVALVIALVGAPSNGPVGTGRLRNSGSSPITLRAK